MGLRWRSEWSWSESRGTMLPEAKSFAVSRTGAKIHATFADFYVRQQNALHVLAIV